MTLVFIVIRKHATCGTPYSGINRIVPLCAKMQILCVYQTNQPTYRSVENKKNIYDESVTIRRRRYYYFPTQITQRTFSLRGKKQYETFEGLVVSMARMPEVRKHFLKCRFSYIFFSALEQIQNGRYIWMCVVEQQRLRNFVDMNNK